MDYGDSGLLIRLPGDGKVTWTQSRGLARFRRTRVRNGVSGVNFTVAGARYHNLRELVCTPVNADRRLYRDAHGRYVLDMKERYPIFDSCDAIDEDRYFHWYLILEADRLSMVYRDDGRPGIDITEDVRKLPGKVVEILKFWRYLDGDGVLRLN